MSVSPAFVDRVVAEVVRRLAATDAAAASGGTTDLTGERVLTGELIEARCKPGSTIALHPQAIATPTARDAIGRLGLQIVPAGSGSPSALPAAISLRVQTGGAPDRLAERLGHPSELVSQREAVERGRSIIARGEAAAVVALTTQPHQLAVKLNRQSGVWAAAVSDPDGVAELIDCPRWNIACVRVDAATAPRLLDPLSRFVRTRTGGSA